MRVRAASNALSRYGGAHAPGVGDEAWREGGVESIAQKADISTLLREMRQLCV
jgi:hypothetical protein